MPGDHLAPRSQHYSATTIPRLPNSEEYTSPSSTPSAHSLGIGPVDGPRRPTLPDPLPPAIAYEGHPPLSDESQDLWLRQDRLWRTHFERVHNNAWQQYQWAQHMHSVAEHCQTQLGNSETNAVQATKRAERAECEVARLRQQLGAAEKARETQRQLAHMATMMTAAEVRRARTAEWVAGRTSEDPQGIQDSNPVHPAHHPSPALSDPAPSIASWRKHLVQTRDVQSCPTREAGAFSLTENMPEIAGRYQPIVLPDQEMYIADERGIRPAERAIPELYLSLANSQIEVDGRGGQKESSNDTTQPPPRSSALWLTRESPGRRMRLEFPSARPKSKGEQAITQRQPHLEPSSQSPPTHRPHPARAASTIEEATPTIQLPQHSLQLRPRQDWTIPPAAEQARNRPRKSSTTQRKRPQLQSAKVWQLIKKFSR